LRKKIGFVCLECGHKKKLKNTKMLQDYMKTKNPNCPKCNVEMDINFNKRRQKR